MVRKKNNMVDPIKGVIERVDSTLNFDDQISISTISSEIVEHNKNESERVASSISIRGINKVQPTRVIQQWVGEEDQLDTEAINNPVEEGRIIDYFGARISSTTYFYIGT